MTGVTITMSIVAVAISIHSVIRTRRSLVRIRQVLARLERQTLRGPLNSREEDDAIREHAQKHGGRWRG